MSISPLKVLVDRELEKHNTTFTDFIESGTADGKTVRQLANELEQLVDAEVSWRTVYRWLSSERRAAS